MSSAILELITTALKLVFTIVTQVMKWNAEERSRFEERMRTISSLLKEAVENKDESLNEEDYLSNLEWEKQQRYLAYKTQALTILNQGGGINELSVASTMGMGLAVVKNKDAVISVLLKNLDVEEKSKWIAKEIL